MQSPTLSVFRLCIWNCSHHLPTPQYSWKLMPRHWRLHPLALLSPGFPTHNKPQDIREWGEGWHAVNHHELVASPSEVDGFCQVPLTQLTLQIWGPVSLPCAIEPQKRAWLSSLPTSFSCPLPTSLHTVLGESLLKQPWLSGHVFPDCKEVKQRPKAQCPLFVLSCLPTLSCNSEEGDLKQWHLPLWFSVP